MMPHALVVDNLRRDGCAESEPMPAQEIADIYTFLSARPVHNGHVVSHSKGEPLPFAEALTRTDWSMFCWTYDDIMMAPHFLEHAFKTHDIARDYFGEAPILYSVNALCTQPSHVHYQYTHDWHRDGDCEKQLVLFVYGTDVLTPGHGAHLYKCGSLLRLGNELGHGVATFTGPAGTAFLTDTTGLHMGMKPQIGHRMLLWARWGNDPLPSTYVYEKVRPIPKERIGD